MRGYLKAIALKGKVSKLETVHGKDGLTPYIGENGNWWIGDEDTGVQAGYRGPVIPAGILYGDVNGDGKVNAKDARQVRLYLSGEIPEAALRLELADVNADGVVDETDAELIDRYAADLITSFDAGKYVNWKPDGAYYYHDLIVGGITKDMAITLIAPGVKLVKTECMDGYIRVFVTEPPAKDAPFSLGSGDSGGGTIKEIDLSNFDNGSISEILSDGTENIYPVAFDESRRPISIGGLAITWGDVGV